MNKVKRFSYKSIFIIFILIIASILLSLIFNSNFTYESKQPINTLINLLIAGVIIGFILFIKPINFKFNKITYIVLFFVVLVIQMYIFSSIMFKTGWDSMFILDDATALRDGYIDLISFDYYEIYPNNTLLFAIYYGIACFLKVFGITAKKYVILNIVLINSVISNIACLLVYRIVSKHTNNTLALISYILSIILIALCPWNVVCYSDELALIIPVLVLYIYDFVDNKYIKVIAVSLLCFLGYSLKPQSIIVVIAIIIINILNINRKNLKELICKLVIGLLIVFICSLIKDNAIRQLGFTKDSNKELGLSHFVMMGLNRDSYGAYNQMDADSSINCETKYDRNNYNLKLINQRLDSFDNVFDYIDFVSKKIVVTFNDGSFSWGKEGDFYVKDYSFNLPLSNVLKEYFYNDGSMYHIYVNLVQVMWFIVLIGCMFAVFVKDKEDVIFVLITSLVGVVLFQLIFETRARYLYVNLPLFLIMSMISINSFKLKLINKNSI